MQETFNSQGPQNVGPAKIKDQNEIKKLERSKLVEEIYKKYDKELRHWCTYKIYNYHNKIFSNPKSDIEDIINSTYQRLLASENPIDLTRPEHEVIAYLNLVLDGIISETVKKARAAKRIKKEETVSLDQLLDEKGEEDFDLRLKKYFTEKDDASAENEEMHSLIKEALLSLNNKKYENIIKKRYEEGKTIEETRKELNISRNGVIDLEKRAIRNIKSAIKKKYPAFRVKN